MKVYNFTEGEVYEGGCHWKSTGFEIRLNEEVGHACRHCHSEKIEIGPTSYDAKKTYEWRSYICPAVVVAYNEGGQCSTGVCLLCILEAKEQILQSDNNALSLPG